MGRELPWVVSLAPATTGKGLGSAGGLGTVWLAVSDGVGCAELELCRLNRVGARRGCRRLGRCRWPCRRGCCDRGVLGRSGAGHGELEGVILLGQRLYRLVDVAARGQEVLRDVRAYVPRAAAGRGAEGQADSKAVLAAVQAERRKNNERPGIQSW